MLVQVDLAPTDNTHDDPHDDARAGGCVGNRADAREMQALTWLDHDEFLYSQRHRHAKARNRYVLCRAALRSVLCDFIECDNADLKFGKSKHGKPYAVVNSTRVAVEFNVSHSGGYGLIAIVSAGRVGVDVEDIAVPRNVDRLTSAGGLITKMFTANERNTLLKLNECEHVRKCGSSSAMKLRLFLQLWVLKEALVKAHGKGMALGFSSFEVPQNMRTGSSVCRGLAHSSVDGDHTNAVCCAHPGIEHMNCEHLNGEHTGIGRTNCEHVHGVFRFVDTPTVTWDIYNVSTDEFISAVAHERVLASECKSATSFGM